MAGAYFAFQAAAILMWWLAIYESAEFRAYFLAEGSPERDLLAFWMPDVLLVGGGSMLTAIGFFLGWAWAFPVAWAVAGGLVYATLYCLALAWMSDSAWLSVVMMTPSAFFSCVFALDLSRGEVPFFRTARVSGRSRNILKTLAQIVLMWTLLLAALPWSIAWVERQLGFMPFSFSGQDWIAAVAFTLASGLGIASGMALAVHGQGTPLPFDAPARLVASGPYAYIRNPMIVSGLGQGLAVACALGSWFVLGYVVVGGIGWHFLVKPAEETDLLTRFGESYQSYRQHVACWRPRLTPYAGSREE